MKKTLVIFLLILVFFVLFFLQSNFFTWFHIAGIMPNLFIVFVLWIGLFAGRTTGSLMGMLFGLLLDIFLGTKVGMTGILLGIIGFAGGYLDKNFSKDSKITIILMSVCATFFFEIIKYILMISFQASMEVEIGKLLAIVLVESIYHSILIIIFYPLLQKIGYRVEDIFQGSNVLTRYF